MKPGGQPRIWHNVVAQHQIGSQETWVLLAAWVTPHTSLYLLEISLLWENEWVSRILWTLKKTSLVRLQKLVCRWSIEHHAWCGAGARWVTVTVVVVSCYSYLSLKGGCEGEGRWSTGAVQVWGLGTLENILSWWGWSSPRGLRLKIWIFRSLLPR